MARGAALASGKFRRPRRVAESDRYPDRRRRKYLYADGFRTSAGGEGGGLRSAEPGQDGEHQRVAQSLPTCRRPQHHGDDGPRRTEAGGLTTFVHNPQGEQTWQRDIGSPSIAPFRIQPRWRRTESLQGRPLSPMAAASWPAATPQRLTSKGSLSAPP